MLLLKNALLSLLLLHDISTHVVAFRGRSKGFQAEDERRHLETKAVKCSKSETATDTTVECGGVYDGSVTLTRNLRCTSSITAITLNGPDTTLDCQGKAIIGDPTLTDTGIQANDGVTIRNCIVTGFRRRAIRLNGGISQVLDTTVINTDSQCSSSFSCRGIELEGVMGAEYTINGVRVYGFGGDGIFYGSLTPVKITIRNTVSAGNGFDGIFISFGATEATIEDTASFQNGNDGINMRASTASMSGINAFENGEDGIDIDSSSTISAFSNVESVFNGDGDLGDENLEVRGDVTLGENVYACYGVQNDVVVSGSATTTVTGDAICDTANSVNFNCTGQCDANGTAAATVCVPNP